MKIVVKWKYPDETKIRENIYTDIDPASIYVSSQFVGFSQSREESGWQFPLSHIIHLNVREEL